MPDRLIREKKGLEIRRRPVRLVLDAAAADAQDVRAWGPMALRVTRVHPAGPADRCGLQPGDAIMFANGLRTRRPSDLRLALWRRDGKGLKKRMALRVVRGGEILDLFAPVRTPAASAQVAPRPAESRCRRPDVTTPGRRSGGGRSAPRTASTPPTRRQAKKQQQREHRS